MTSDEFAKAATSLVALVMRDEPESPGASRLSQMLRERITTTGTTYEVADDVQAVEVKPLEALVRDIREEATDMAAYATALHLRTPGLGTHADAGNLVSLAVRAMEAADRIEVALSEEGVSA